MPPPGSAKKKKKGRAPKHQNSFAFRHNPKSKKTDKILASPNVGVCRRCYDKIEWRKKYRKYKPRTQPGKCNLCARKNVLAAYHTLCTACVGTDKAIDAMEKRMGGGTAAASACEGDPAPEDETLKGEADAPVNNDLDAPNTGPDDSTKPATASRRRLHVCAVCAAAPAMSKYANASPEDMDIVERIHALEDAIDAGVQADGRKLTLREIKGLERKVEKLQGELKERGKKRREEEEEEDGEDEGEGQDREEGGDAEEDEENSDEVESVDGEEEAARDKEEQDPFLAATGGKALVGEEYQKMLLARAQQS